MKAFLRNWWPLLFLCCAALFNGWQVYRRDREQARTILNLQRQFADVVRFVQGAQRTQIQGEAERVRERPVRVAQPWARAMTAWYQDAGIPVSNAVGEASRARAGPRSRR